MAFAKRRVRTSMLPWGVAGRAKGSRGGVKLIEQRFTSMLVLSRVDNNGDDAPVDEGYISSLGFCWFVGTGNYQPQTPSLLTLADDGDAVTIMVKYWPAGNLDTPGFARLSSPQEIVKIGSVSIRVVDPQQPLTQLAVYSGDSRETDLVESTPQPANYFFVLRNVSGTVFASVYGSGGVVHDVQAAIPTSLDFSSIDFGNGLASDGGFSQAAVWNRALLQSEIDSIGDNINCPDLDPDPDPGGGNDEDDDTPLVDSGGRSAISPDSTMPMSRRVGVVRSLPGRVDARRTHEHEARVYELQWNVIPAAELALVRRAYELTRRAGYTRWNHPIDDPPSSPGSATRWRIVNDLELDRFAGGSLAGLTLILEEVP